jgi:hypothetical protein
MIDYSKVAQVIAQRWSPITATLCTSVARQRKRQQKLATVIQQELVAAHQAPPDDWVHRASEKAMHDILGTLDNRGHVLKHEGGKSAPVMVPNEMIGLIRDAIQRYVPASISIEQALAFCHLLRDRAAQMSREEFHKVLHSVLGCDKEYSENVRIHFQNNPAAFLAHRTPQTQSVELLKFIFSMPEK